jgi:hypothetical protein
MRLLIAVLVAVICAAALSLFILRSRPVVIGLGESGDPVHEPVFSLMNPFRDRAPERAASALLEDLKRGDYRAAVSKISDRTALNDERLAREKENRLQSWRLMNRSDRGGETKLFYRVARGSASANDSPLWITVKRSGGDHWRVVNYDTWY